MSSNDVAITGYYASGSSAVMDLLKEYDGVNITPFDGYEHIALYAPNGLFDLGAILRYSNTPYNSDGAIGRFQQEMQKLNDNDFGGFGSYQKLTGEKFDCIVNSFLNQISHQREFRGSCHAERVTFSLIKAGLQIAAKIVFGRKIAKLGRKYCYDHMQPRIGLPSDEEFCSAAKKFTTDYLNIFDQSDMLNVYDHLLWPQNQALLPDYFDNSLKMIIVNRDPRDVFLLNKYFLHKPPRVLTKPYFPTDVKMFCDEWRRTVETQNLNPKQVLFLNFEDMVYYTEETYSVIESFLNIPTSSHRRIKEIFNPDKSIENTQIFTVDEPEWKKEAEYIEKQLPDMLYHFPYVRKCDRTKWFDNPNVDLKQRKRKNG